MSSRALRKAQKERERQELEEQQDEEDIADDGPIAKTQQSAFAMLGEENEDDDNEQGEGEQVGDQSDDPADADRNDTSVAPNSTTTSNKRKKKKKKAKAKQATSQAADVDEIDIALKSLSAKDAKKSGLPSHDQFDSNELLAKDDSLLAVEPHHLQVANEMRRVFGRAAFTADQEEREDHRRRVQEGDHTSLSEAVTGRYAIGGPGLPAVLRRRNIFVQGKEEWPKNTSNGLTMEVEHRQENGVTTYRFVHGQNYKVSQLNFAQSVQTMDPNTMVNMLRYFPYHVATLLQVSEIAKQEKDYATSGELLERALFAFGKSLHPSFAKDIALGKARLDFRRLENREFFLAASRYIVNIGMRATWRTAYEWSRLLLALDPDQDPYCMGLVIDQLALRARQLTSFIDLTNSRRFSQKWEGMPNIRYSVSLATRMQDKDSIDATTSLMEAVREFPWVAARLLQQLDVAKLPPSVWGKTATTEKDILHTELYATFAQDVWKLPDARSFLIEAVSDMTPSGTDVERHNTDNITVNEARYVILADKPPLIGLLPRTLTARVDSMADPLRPDDSIDDYDSSTIARLRGDDGDSNIAADELIREDPRRFITEIMSLQSFFEEVVPNNINPEDANEEEAINRALGEAGISAAEMHLRVRRLMQLRTALQARPNAVVESGNHQVYIGENDMASIRSINGEDESTIFGLDAENANRIENEVTQEMRLRAEQDNDETTRDQYVPPGGWVG